MPSIKKKSFSEFKAVFLLSIILAFRMLGLFMIYPVFTLDANNLQSASPTLIGIALGIYGLTQGVFQLPLSSLSDRFGRRPIIFAGLVLFGLGSVLAACANSIYMIIIGRALQGAGAIGSTLLAYAADITSLENRTKTMAVMGLTIGVSFGVAIVLGPILNDLLHLSGLFWITAVFALVGVTILFFGMPDTATNIKIQNRQAVFQSIKQLLVATDLIYLNVSIFILHAILTATFMVIPHLLENGLGITSKQQWLVYLPTLLFAFVCVLPMLHLTEKKNNIKLAIIASIGAISFAQFLWFFSMSSSAIILALMLFFLGFTLLEAILPSLVSKLAANNNKGAALGIFSTWQFLGIFMGGLIGGMIQNYWGTSIVCLSSAVIALLWLMKMAFMNPLPYFKTELIHFNNPIDEVHARQLCDMLSSVPGVLEATVSIQDSIAYLKVDNKIFSKERLLRVTTEFQDSMSNNSILVVS